ncbi:hypothetical protein BN137_3149 [Cronobacter condimenti 1330]|uniref:Uncharacterized protein n=1 Tax=Cronobacter condimenti 1330 TaxID=1073999 RepID=K8A2D1_9ENTR|nr:hypothetical protein BN137_3149 [Cronobacter condimenti 1330]
MNLVIVMIDTCAPLRTAKTRRALAKGGRMVPQFLVNGK